MGLKKGDQVVFIIGNDKTIYTVASDERTLYGRKVVDLKDYPGEVAVEYLTKYQSE
ncbi:hypothetical protein [Cohnella massiliensis]|uniref:hypothetical protein n=1 Tax=Cohnella massiliensis TaxID=1816691 RepID=UPI001593EEB1|nr:hypothetical protein [Cohnella massiliensis]